MSAQQTVQRAKEAQPRWAATPLRARLALLRQLRSELARAQLPVVIAPDRPLAELLSAELLPLAAAARWLERRAPGVLRTRREGPLGAPWWLGAVSVETAREPRGVVLVIGPSNYPLLLTGVPALQALAAGCSVVIKPGRGGEAAAAWLAERLRACGLPEGTLGLLDESPAAAQAAIAAGVDLVLLTGSTASGRAVLQACAETLTPAVLELSGCDALIVLPGADLDRVVDCLAFGLALNGSRTCMAPRRILVVEELAERLVVRLTDRLARMPALPLPPDAARRIADLTARGCRVLLGAAGEAGPVLLEAPPALNLEVDWFAPWIAVQPVGDVDEAVERVNDAAYGLSASVFGPAGPAAELAGRLRVGMVTINDVIVPSADPRATFGGRRASGFGVTRGPDGLLAMTTPKVVVRRHGRWLPHLLPEQADAPLLGSIMLAQHASTWRERGAAWRALARRARKAGRGE